MPEIGIYVGLPAFKFAKLRRIPARGQYSLNDFLLTQYQPKASLLTTPTSLFISSPVGSLMPKLSKYSVLSILVLLRQVCHYVQVFAHAVPLPFLSKHQKLRLMLLPLAFAYALLSEEFIKHTL